MSSLTEAEQARLRAIADGAEPNFHSDFNLVIKAAKIKDMKLAQRRVAISETLVLEYDEFVQETLTLMNEKDLLVIEMRRLNELARCLDYEIPFPEVK
jgi:hypothetical protein